MANLINGKQLRQSTLRENLLLVTGSTASAGQILSFDASNGGFEWINDLSLTGGTYDNPSGTITFTDNSGGTFDVDGFSTGGTPSWAAVLAEGNTSSGTDAVMTAGDVISSSSGGGQLNLRAFGLDSNVSLTSGFGSFSGSTLSLSPTVAGLYLSDAAQTDYNYVEFADTYGVLWGNRNGTDNSVTVQTTTSGGAVEVDGIQLNSVTGSISLSAGTGDIFIFNTLPSDNALTSVLARDPVGGGIKEVSISGFTSDTVVTGGTYANGTGLITFTDNTASTFDVDLNAMDLNDTFISGMTFNVGNYDLTIDRNDGTSFTESLSILASDMVVTGGTYDTGTGIVTFTNNSGGTFGVSGFVTGMTDSFTSTAFTSGTTIHFDNNIQGSDLYSVDILPIITGQTPFQYNAGTASAIEPRLGTNVATGTYAAIGGGSKNTASGNYAVVAGGSGNTVSDIYGFIGSGKNNIASNEYSIVVGGQDNTTSGTHSFIGGGSNNIASGSTSFVGGGNNNRAGNSYSTIGGGSGNISVNSSNYATIAGGYNNRTGGYYSAIGGGYGNVIGSGYAATIGGGNTNTALGSRSTIGGGQNNQISGGTESATIAGGFGNTVSGNRSTIGGGQNGNISSDFSTIAGGELNTITGVSSNQSFIGGGVSNQINSPQSTIGGGDRNIIGTSSSNSFIGGGQLNTVIEDQASVVGGLRNSSGGKYSFIGSGEDNTVGAGTGVSARFSSILNGRLNAVTGESEYSLILGGIENTVQAANFSSIIGGSGNTITGANSLIVGGVGNTLTHTNAHILGSNITSFANDTTHVDRFNINTLNGTAAVTALAIDANGMVVDGSALGIADTVVTGGTYVNGTGLITFTNNVAGTFDVDLGTIDLNDTFITAGTVSNGALALEDSDGGTVNVTGAIVQTVIGNAPITASTTNGAVEVGLDYSLLQLAVQTSDDKNATPTATTGVSASTGVAITNTPVNDGYVKVEINGIGYFVADGDGERVASDCYFSADGGTTARAMSAIIATDVLFWNNNSSFDLETSDRVDFFYEILQ